MLPVNFIHCKMEEKNRMILETLLVKIINISTTKLFSLSTYYDPRNKNNWEKMFTLGYVQKAMV